MKAVVGAIFVISLGFSSAWAKKVEIREEDAAELPPKASNETGKNSAQKYFSTPRNPSAESSGGGSRDHYLALHLGGFVSSTSYVWGKNTRSEDVGKLNMGITYRMGEWINSADSLLRVDFQSYEVDESKPFKMSVIFAAAFPDANSRFPLYFGAGVGPGIFFKQARSESPISLDYQLFGGGRFFDVAEGVGFFAEAGLKNHLHLLDDGQFNSTFFALGALFTF